jgi:hypothetical protein
MRTLLFASCAGGAVALAALGACSSDDSDADGGGGAEVNDLGQCETNDAADAGKFPHSALPTGQPCAASTSCHMPIDDCASDWSETPGGPNLQEYECLCANGAWACTIAVNVDETCTAAPEAGADASTDAGADASTDDAPLDSPTATDSPGDAPLDAADGAQLDASSDAAD